MALKSENGRTLRKLAVVALGMFGFGYALVPFYKQICEVAGLNQIQQSETVVNSQVDTSRTLVLEFDANTGSELPWQFRPVERSLKVHPGQLVQVDYEVRNDSDEVVTGQAIPSYGPRIAQRYFRKLDCFCFATQELKPREVRRMPVVFVVLPEIPAEVGTITLSYTFFRVEGAAKAAATRDPVGTRIGAS